MILIVSDNRQRSAQLLMCIKRVSEDCDIVCASAGVIQRCLQKRYPVVLIDASLPLSEHVELIRQLQLNLPDSAIILMAHNGCDAERIMGLELGAQDYIEYPFNPAEVQARIRVQLRRVEHRLQQDNNGQKPIRIGSFSIDNSYHRAELDGKCLPLTAKEFSLLHFLASHPDQVFSREQLLTCVWGYHYGGFEHTVASHVNRLRSKLGKTAAGVNLVETVWGVGYKFNSACLLLAQSA
ncbi:response regulator transcription factor [Alteromonas lipolytica]|uniref:Phosphate regulon transcriptional regulatory protein PhoB n=1 Tax=Alteromonas lipolytica TaxID=1856405 RepID=A0A1E8FCY3_9ALTE|nr:response regulator transcription factor [Alteromonas lipolytica]OFI33781.1 hypothetical protein BFC17_19615 [Alteromonas lipolytica]GGF68441.1 DNA-binding response regulator [Alteromonas lipolytica]